MSIILVTTNLGMKERFCWHNHYRLAAKYGQVNSSFGALMLSFARSVTQAVLEQVPPPLC